MHILLSNDDGIFSPGLHALARALAPVAERIHVVAPDVEQSASGHAITIRHPLRYRHTALEELAAFDNVEAFRVDGTPADCVVLGVHNGGRPDLIMSGINLGSNLGFDVTHSGTVAAALEGTTMGIPSVALSLRTGGEELDFSHAARYAARLAPRIVAQGLPDRTLLNVNFPFGAPKGIRIGVQSTHSYQDSVVQRVDPEGEPYYWVAGTPTGEREPGTDYTWVVEGYASVTPLHLDLTDRGYLEALGAALQEIDGR